MEAGSSISISKKFARQFLVADSPEKVSTIVDELESSQNVDWKPLGGEPNNYGTVQTQASNPMPCFVELKANADDAVLMIQPDGETRTFFATVQEEEGNLSGGTTVNMDTYESLDTCITEKYVGQQFDDPVLCKDLYRVFESVDGVHLEESGHLPLQEPHTLM